MNQPTDKVLVAIRNLLGEHDVPFREVHHEPTFTSEESARARGEPLEIGGKALLLKVDERMALFVLPAHCRIDSKAIRRRLGAKRSRFASREELFEQTGLVPGSVPPFGEPILPFELFVDSRIADNDRIAFNAGSLTTSLILGTNDYLRVAQPRELFRFSPTTDH